MLDGFPDDMKYYDKIRVIGRGSYGLVFEGIITKGKHIGEHVAIKEINLDKLDHKKYTYFLVRIKNKNFL